MSSYHAGRLPAEGEAVYWLHTPRGGYGYTRRVPAVVVKPCASGKRVLIRAQLSDGGTALRHVSPGKLRPQGQAGD